MKKQIASLFVVTAFVVMAMMLPALAASHSRSIGPQNQFHIQPKKGLSAAYDKLQQRLASAQAARQERLAKMGILPATAAKAMATKPKSRRNTPGLAPGVGFVAATQIPAGGFVSSNPAREGDFNGDGKKDLLTIVSSATSVISISVALGHGDGTFSAPALTAIPANSSDDFMVGDLNGDGKDDVVVVHQLGSISSNSSFDVFLSNGDGTFTAGSNFVVTANEVAGGILYDLNGDGKLDMVAVDSAGASGTGVGNVWVLLGNGDGTFQAPAQTPLSSHAGSSLVFGDFNGDGLLDFADNDYVTSQLTVYMGTSSAPQFAPAVSYVTSDGVNADCSNAVGDMTGDGKPEIVSVNCSADTITVYTNDGTGIFSTGVYYASAMASPTATTGFLQPNAATIADVNGDGFGDVILTNALSGDIGILLGNGDGSVQVPSFGYTTGGFPFTSAVVADFNGDGLADIVLPDYLYSFAYLKGYGDGTFRASVDYYSPTADSGTPYGWDIATGDFNGDGIPDVVMGNWCCDTAVGISVFLGRGDGTLLPGVNYGSGGNLAYVAVADFNKDGKLDIAAVDNSLGQVDIFLGNGDGTFPATPSATIATNDSDSRKIVVADLNGDGYPDLVVANANGATAGVIMNDGTGAFLAQVPYTLNGLAYSVAVADVNGDGKLDLLLPENATGNLAVLLGNGDGTFQGENDFSLGNNPVDIAVGDLNGDGKLDVAATMDDYTNGMGIAVALGNGDGTFSPGNVPPYPSSLQSNFAYNSVPDNLRLVDLNGDGILDVVYTNHQYGTVGVVFGNGDGSLSLPTEYPTGQWAFGIALADLNGDGAVDVVTASTNMSEASVLLNNSGSKELPDYTLTSNTTSATVTAGQSATVMFTLTPRNFYNGTVTFSCTGLPSKAACVFSNPTLTPNGNAVMTSTLTITTTAATTAMLTPVPGNPWTGNTGNTSLLAGFSLVGTLGLMLAGFSRKNRRLAVVLGVLALGMMIVTVGCGGGNSAVVTPPQIIPGTPAGSYPIVVTATGTAGTNGGNTSAHTVTVNLTVQ